jgi:DNA-damage-inducible protein D
MDKRLIQELKLTFDDIMHTTEEGLEYWYARELKDVLGYSNWQNFVKVVNKARNACTNSGSIEIDHFIDVSKMVSSGVADIPVKDVMLTRYACYLIAQNGDPRKDEIAFAQSYFAVQTRKAEIIEQRLADINRLQLRDQLKTSEKRLSQNIFERGVDEKGFGRIRSKGDAALFGGKTTQNMKDLYGIKSGALADKLPAVTLAAKNLATEMTNLNVEDKDLHGESSITTEHVQNNSSVRKMLGERGIKPESLPPEEDTKKIERRLKADERKIAKLDNK